MHVHMLRNNRGGVMWNAEYALWSLFGWPKWFGKLVYPANMDSRPMSSETLMHGIGQVAVKCGEPMSSRKRELEEKMQVT